MRINNITQSLYQTSFKAKTQIIDSEKLLTTEQKAQLQNVGAKIGTDSDKIEVAIFNVNNPKFLPREDCFLFIRDHNIETKEGTHIMHSSSIIPFKKEGTIIEDNSPFTVLQRYFNSLSNLK